MLCFRHHLHIILICTLLPHCICAGLKCQIRIHQHTALLHAHRHVHDKHHQHMHEPWDDNQPHDHIHEHTILEHGHRHVPDIHHRHTHAEKPDLEKDKDERHHSNSKNHTE